MRIRFSLKKSLKSKNLKSEEENKKKKKEVYTVLKNEILKQELQNRDGKSYPAYKDVKGKWSFPNYVLSIDHVQSDPYASPSSISISIEQSGLPKHFYENKINRLMTQDILLRFFNEELAALKKKGEAYDIYCSSTTPEILERSACSIDQKTGAILLALKVQFPGKGRKIWVDPLVKTLFHQLPKLVRKTLLFNTLPLSYQEALQEGFELSCNQQSLRQQMRDQGLIAFVANGAILPRQSGASSLPMKEAIPFVSSKENEITLSVPYAINGQNEISGLAIPKGITLIVGGGYHGKSTLLNALEMGIYDHRARDGREYVLTQNDAVKIRSEDGRAVHHENISFFIQNLPNKKSTLDFVSEDASGSTSQAANVVEALEANSSVLLMDEDTSATNFMIRDPLMSAVVANEEEPIIPYISRIQELANQGISTILVAGSSGAYFEKANIILQMKNYQPYNITALAKEKFQEVFNHTPKNFQGPMNTKDSFEFLRSPHRAVLPNSRLLANRVKVKSTHPSTLSVAKESISLWALEQLVDSQQTITLGKMIVYAHRHLVDGQKSLSEIVDELLALQEHKGLSFLGQGDLANVRKYELMGAFNRMRSQDFELKSE